MGESDKVSRVGACAVNRLNIRHLAFAKQEIELGFALHVLRCYQKCRQLREGRDLKDATFCGDVHIASPILFKAQ